MRHAVLLALFACGSSSGDDDTIADAPPSNGNVVLPPSDTRLDYQLGGAYAPPSGVGIVSRDRQAAPASGVYTICYINGFQIQPGEDAMWTQPVDLVLRDGTGKAVIDTEWNEALIDVGTADKRAAVAAIIDGWIDGCQQAGFQAIEIDNLDSYSRSRGLLTQDDAVATMQLFSQHAHARGLAIAQKNASELVPRKGELGTDFVVAEECNRYSECDAYRSGYGDHVLVIEYRRQDFTAGCQAFPQLSIVLRDRHLVPAGSAGYVYDGC